nr:MAG TPA: hypothetical protein [Caudoviricetes sp.]
MGYQSLIGLIPHFLAFYFITKRRWRVSMRLGLNILFQMRFSILYIVCRSNDCHIKALWFKTQNRI